jgi:hypothetical protein
MRHPPVLLDHRTPSSGLQQNPRKAGVPTTRRASFDRAWRSALVACLLCFGALADTASAQEPEITTFLDFYSHRQSCGMRTHAHDHTFVQGFSTGGNETGYTLREVEFLVGRHPKYFTVHPQISLVEASPLFTSEVATLQFNRKRPIGSSSIEWLIDTMATYTVPEDVTLDPSTTYYLKFTAPQQEGYSVTFYRQKAHPVERPNQYGWSMVSSMYWTEPGWTYYNVSSVGGRPCSIRITARGFANPPTPRMQRTAHFEGLPKRHDGESAFTGLIRFSAEPRGLTAQTVANGVVEVTGGTVTGARRPAATGARRTDEDEQPAWEVTVAPDGPGDIMLRLPARACDETHAVCIEGEPLDEAAQAMVPGTPLTAQFTQAPETHDGSNAFEVDMDFSHEPAGFSYRTVRDALFDVEGGRIERAQRRERGRNRLWRIRVVPETSGDVTLAVRTTTDCAAPYAACGANGRKLAGNARLTVRGPASPTAPAVSVAPPAATPVTEGAALGFALTRTGETTQALTVTVSVTETGTTLSGTPPASATFASGSDRAVLSVATEDDEASEAASTVTATVSPGEGYTVEDASASAQAVVEDDDAVPVVSTASPIVVAENQTAVATLTATDADTAAEALAWSLPEGESGGTDAAQFTLSAEGALAFRAAKDFEAPDDANADGDYEVTVRVTDGSNPVDVPLVVRLADVEDAAPAVSTASPIVVAENQTAVATGPRSSRSRRRMRTPPPRRWRGRFRKEGPGARTQRSSH